MNPIPGIFENGVVRPLAPVDLPEQTMVTIVMPEPSLPAEIGCNSDDLYEILNRRYNTGETDLAARVDELDP